MPEIKELMVSNPFREAAELLKAKDNGAELTEEEHALIATAGIPLDVNTGFFPKDITTDEGLDALAKMLEEASRGNKKVESSQGTQGNSCNQASQTVKGTRRR